MLKNIINHIWKSEIGEMIKNNYSTTENYRKPKHY